MPLMHPRSTNFSLKNNDTRPIKDAAFISQSISKIYDFMIKENFEKVLSIKELSSPQAKDFQNLFTYLVNKIRPDSNIQVNKLDEDVIPILQTLRYPGFITKTHLVAVGAPNTWPNLLAVLVWLVELSDYMYFEEICAARESVEETDRENNEKKILENINHNQNQNENITEKNFKAAQDKTFEAEWKTFLINGYKQQLSKNECLRSH